MAACIRNNIPTFIILCLLLHISSILYSAEIVEVPLSDLNGLYSDDATRLRSVEFQLNRIPTTVYRVWLSLSGTFNLGQLMCEHYGLWHPSPWPLEFLAIMNDTLTGGHWSSYNVIIEESGAFNITSSFRRKNEATWEFLKLGGGIVELYGSPLGYVLICAEDFMPTAIVEEALLLIEADFPVAVDESTWGSIKALFK